MKKFWIAVIAPPAIVLFVWLFCELVMHLWNWLLPSLFGFHAITFWQALGLLLLSRIFFGSWGSGSGNRKARRRDRWEKLSPEEREKMRKRWGERCWDARPTPNQGDNPV
jgi:hypothetical protein